MVFGEINLLMSCSGNLLGILSQYKSKKKLQKQNKTKQKTNKKQKQTNKQKTLCLQEILISMSENVKTKVKKKITEGKDATKC